MNIGAFQDFPRTVLTAKLRGTEIAQVPPVPTHAWLPPLSTSSTRVALLLQLMSLP